MTKLWLDKEFLKNILEEFLLYLDRYSVFENFKIKVRN